MPATSPTELDDLSEAERFLVMAAARGETIDLKRHTIRGTVLRDLILEARDGWRLPQAGLRVQRVIVDGGLDLEGCSVPRPVLLWHSRIQGGGDRGALVVRDARLKRLGIHSSTVDGNIVADRVEIENGLFLGGGLVKGTLFVRGAGVDGALAIEGTEIGDGKQAILAAGLALTGPLILRRARIKGEVAIPRAQIGAGLYGEEMTLARDGLALNAESSRVTGDVLLDRANVTGSLRLTNARIGGQLSAEGLVVASTPAAVHGTGLNVGQSVNLSGARIAGTVSLEGADIGKMFRAEGVEIWGGDVSIGADVIRIGGNWDLARAKLTGHMSLPGAEINGQLRLTEARVFGDDLAIRGDGARIRGGCFLSRATILGLVRFPACEIGNQFRLRGATLKVTHGAALLASGTHFARDVELDSGFNSTGAVVLDQTVIGGACDLSGSRIVSLALSGEPVTTGVREGAAAPDADQRWQELALSLVDGRIDRLTMPARAEDRPKGIIDLSRAETGYFLDFAAAWPPPPAFRGRNRNGRDIDHIVLDGFRTEHLGNPSGGELRPGNAPALELAAGPRRVRWLESQAEEDVSRHFKPQAWVELARRLSQQGHREDARTVTIARRRRELASLSTTSGQRWQGRLLDLFALYGFNPWRTVAWMMVLVLMFSGLWSVAALQCERPGCRDESVFVISNRDAYTPEAFERTYPAFNAVAYSLDVFVPFVPLGYEDHWRPNVAWRPLATLTLPEQVSGPVRRWLGEPEGGDSGVAMTVTAGGLLYVLMLVETLLGLVLASLAVTGFTGLLTHDE